MLNLPLSDVETTIFLVLILFWAVLLFGGFIFGKPCEDETRRMPLPTRLLSSFTLVIGAWTWFAISRGTPVDTFATWLAIGMTLGFIGDVFMANVLPLENHVIYGMLSFGIGHIAYIIGMMMITLPEQSLLYPAISVVLAWWAIAVVLWYFVVYRGSNRETVIYLALPYAILLATTAAIAMNLTFLDITFLPVMIGAILFLVSDLVLAAQLFNGLHFKYVSDVVWFLYGPGQMLIVFGVILYTMIDSLHLFS